MVTVESQDNGPQSPRAVAWQQIHDIIEYLGPDGMSSEDSGVDDEGYECMLVRDQQWRENLDDMLMKVDDIRRDYPRYFKQNGAKPVKRLPLSKGSRREHPNRLPVNLYAPDWYKDLNDYQKWSIQAAPKLLFPDLSVLALEP